MRFAVPSIAPNKMGPVINGAARSTLSAMSMTPGTVRVSWPSNWDYDNETLTYQLYRDSTSTAPGLRADGHEAVLGAPTMGFIDTGLTPGSNQRYRVQVSDPWGNSDYSDWVTVTVADSGDPLSTYAQTPCSTTAPPPTGGWVRPPAARSRTTGPASTTPPSGTGVTRGVAGAVGDTDDASTLRRHDARPGRQPDRDPGPGRVHRRGVVPDDEHGGRQDRRLRQRELRRPARATTGTSTWTRTARLSSACGPAAPPRCPRRSPTTTASGTTWWRLARPERRGAVRRRRAGRPRTRRHRRAGLPGLLAGRWRHRRWSGAAVLPRRHRRRRDLPDGAELPAGRRPLGGLGPDVLDLPAVPATPTAPRCSRCSRTCTGGSARRAGPRRPTPAGRRAPGTYQSGVHARGSRARWPGVATRRPRSTALDGLLSSDRSYANPTVYSEELWFKTTTTTSGGKLIGFGNAATGTVDELRPARLHGDRRPADVRGLDRARTTTSPRRAPTTTVQWHYLVATQSAAGMTLYVDGVLVGIEPADRGADLHRATGGSAVTPPGVRSRGSPARSTRSRSTPQALSARGRRALRARQRRAERGADGGVHAGGRRTWLCRWTGRGPRDSDGTVASYAWDFGDGRRVRG